LNEKRGDKVAEVLLFFFVSKVKVKKRQGGLSSIAQQDDVFDDGRAVVIKFLFLGMRVGK
jgi:hypothetical protein